jgi:hypothetical protein
MTVSLVEVDQPEFVEELRERLPEASAGLREESDIIFLGADERAALARLVDLLRYLKRNGAI